MPEEEVKRRIAVIKDGMSKGRLQKDVAYELGWAQQQSLSDFIRKHGLPKWEKTRFPEKTSAVVQDVLADLREHGQNNRTLQELADQARMPVRQFGNAVARMKRKADDITGDEAANPDFAWQRGGLLEKTLLVRKAIDVAIKDGSVRIPFIRAFANPFPCVAIPSSCATRLSVAAPSQVGRSRLCSKSR
jgi:hypothetical protein